MSRASTIRLALRLGGTLAVVLHAGAAQAAAGELALHSLHGIGGYFADPDNVRGVFGAASGAIAAVLGARPFQRRAARGASHVRRSHDD